MNLKRQYRNYIAAKQIEFKPLICTAWNFTSNRYSSFWKQSQKNSARRNN